jgi:hypothetical protein
LNDLSMLQKWSDVEVHIEKRATGRKPARTRCVAATSNNHNCTGISEHQRTIKGHIGMICAYWKGGNTMGCLGNCPPSSAVQPCLGVQQQPATTTIVWAYLNMKQWSKGILERFQHATEVVRRRKWSHDKVRGEKRACGRNLAKLGLIGQPATTTIV